MSDTRFYAVQRRKTRGLSRQEVTVFSFDDPMQMSDWIEKSNRSTAKRRKSKTDVRREALGTASSDAAVLYHVFDNNPGNNKVIKYRIVEPTVKKEPVDQGPWINIKIPKGASGEVSLRQTTDDYGRAMLEITLPEDLGMVKPAPYKNRRVEPHPVDLSGATIRVMEKARRAVDENGVKGWRQGVVKSMEDKDYFEVGFRKVSKEGEEWKVYATLPDPLPDGSRRRVAVNVTTLNTALDAVIARRHAPIVEKTVERTYPNPDMFRAEPMLDEEGVKRFAWHSDDGEHIIASNYLDEGYWVMESTRDGDLEFYISCMGESFEEAYQAHYELTKAKSDVVNIAGPADSSIVFDDLDQLRVSFGSLEEPSRTWPDLSEGFAAPSLADDVPFDDSFTVTVSREAPMPSIRPAR